MGHGGQGNRGLVSCDWCRGFDMPGSMGLGWHVLREPTSGVPSRPVHSRPQPPGWGALTHGVAWDTRLGDVKSTAP